MKKKLYLILTLNFLFALNNNEDFFKTLNTLTLEVNKNQINIDKVPKNLEIIKRDFIISSGAKTLLDILQYIPGVEIAQNSAGKKQIIVRGSKSRYRDKIKLLINGIDVTNEVYNNQFYFYNFPALLIKRVEFSKTPDSVRYGEKAFLGVINVITLNQYNSDFINFYVNNQKGGMFCGFDNYSNMAIDYHFIINNPNIKKTTSKLIDLQKETSILYRSKSPDEYEKNAGVGIKYQKNDLTLRYRIEYYKYGSFFGIENLIPSKDDKYSKTLFQYLNASNKKYLKDNLINNFQIGVNNFIGYGEYRRYPYDFNETVDNNPDNDIIVGAKISEVSFYLKNILNFTNEKHLTNFIFKLKYTKPYDYYFLNYIPSLNNKKKLAGNKNFLEKNINRKIFAIGFEDLYTLNEKLSFVYGYRYDYYNDFGSNNSYKAAMIWLNKTTTFKLLYNTAFRAPSLIEFYSSFFGNDKLKPEKIKMLEFIWLQKIFNNDKLKLTLYKGTNQNFIGRYALKNGFIYKNLGNYDIKGFELEYKKEFEKDKFNISYSYNHNKAHFSYLLNNINYYAYNYTRNRMLKTYNIYKINPKTTFFFSAIYKSKIKIPFSKPIKKYFAINTNIRYKFKQNSIIFGIDNLTNHPNYDTALPNTIINNRYIFMLKNGSIPKQGRKIYISLIKKWK